MIKAIIFDMDGVIFNSQKVANELMLKTCYKVGANATQEDIDKMQGVGGVEFWQYIKEKYNLPKTPEAYNDIYDEDEEIVAYKYVDLNPGLIDLIDKAKENGIKIALATSASKKRMKAVLKIYNLEDKFDIVICRNDIRKSKPDPEIYNLTANKLGIDNKDCVVLEDAENGVLAAKNANMKCIGYVNPYSGKQDLSKADLTIDHFAQLDVNKLLES